jgi:HK97 family phage major capsid protein
MSVKSLTEKRNDLINRAEEIVSGAEAEKRDLTEDEQKEVETIDNEVRGIKKQLGTLNTVAELSKDLTKRAEDEAAGEKEEKEGEEEDKATEEAEERAFGAYLRAQWGVMNERAGDNTPLSQGENGAVVPLTIAKRIIRKLYDISPIAERATKYNIKGNLAIPYYVEDDSDFINVAFQGPEFEEISANSGKFTTINLGGYVAGALALVSRKMVNNVDFDLVGYVVDQMAYSIRRFLENVLLNGSGAITGQTGTIEGLTGVTQTVNTASATAITGDELIELQDSVKDMFQEGAIWIMSPATRTAIRQLKSNTGYYLLQPDITSAFGYKLLGHDVYVSDNMPDMENGKPAVYYGNLEGLALKFTESLEIQVLREKYATQHADGIIGWFEFDAKVQNAQQISKLVMGGGTPVSA